MTLKKLETVLLFLVIFFLPTQFGKHFWPQFSFVYSLPIDYLSPALYFWDILVILLFSVFLIARKSINKIALLLFLFFMLTQSLSLFSTYANIAVGFIRLEQYSIAGLLGIYLASSKISEIKNVFIVALSLSVVFEAFLAIAQFFKMGTIGLWVFGERTFVLSTPGIAKFDYHGREFLRPYATFPHPNLLAAFLVIAIILYDSWIASLFSKPSFKKIKVFLKTLSLLVILLTASRVAIVTIFVYMGSFITKKTTRILFIFLIVFLFPFFYTRFSSLINYDILAFSRRQELATTSLELWVSTPIIGVGLNNFIPVASELLLSGPSRFLQPVHNIFLLTLSETGVIGMVGFFILVGYPILKLKKNRNVLVIWSVIGFLSLFDHYFLTLPQGNRLLFLIWGLSLSMLE